MPFLQQWRGSSVNVRQSARATHPGMHMPSGHRAHRGLYISRGECCESDAAGTAAASSSAGMPQRRARLRGHVIHHHQHHHTQRKRACPQTTKSKAVPTVSAESRTGFRFIFDHQWRPPFDSVGPKNLQQRQQRTVVGPLETWDLMNGLETCGW